MSFIFPLLVLAGAWFIASGKAREFLQTLAPPQLGGGPEMVPQLPEEERIPPGTSTPMPAPPGGGSLTSASELMSSGTLTCPPDTAGLIILIPNEAHEAPGSKRMAPNTKNGAFLPEKAVIPAGCSVVWVSDDAGHSHTIVVDRAGSTRSINTDAFSEPMRFTQPGTFNYSSKAYAKQGQTGSITVTAGRGAGSGTGRIVGAVFVPSSNQAKYKADLQSAGLQVLSTAPAGKEICMVYQGTGNVIDVATKVTVVTKATPYS